MSHSPVRERAHVLAHLVMLLVRCGGGAVDAPSVRSRAVVHRSSLTRRFEQLEQRLDEMERRAHAAEQLADARLHDLERIMPKEFELFHYNVLADQAGTNMLPWFCYGADVTPAERSEMYRRFYSAGDAYKRRPNKGWPEWAEGVLSPERIKAIEEYDAAVFAWEGRRERLWQTCTKHKVGCRERSPDIITLSECDHYDDFWRERLSEAGYDSVWRKRPRASARDGCAIGWRNATFEIVAEGGADFGPRLNATSQDRCASFVLLRWRRDPSVRLLVATTHLERDPQSADRLISRGYQYGLLFREMLAFANAHGAHEVPVVFTGDFNANDCDELAGIARMIVRLLHSPTHPLLWSIRDAPTGPTSITDERNARIDYVLYQSDRIKLTGSGPPPARGMTTIPNLEHPSDHLPVSSRMKLKSKWDKMEEDARQWLACVSGTTACRPLSGVAVRNAFEYFDKDHAALISPLQLEAGLQQLGFPGLNTNFILDALREAGCRPHPGEHEDTWAMDVEQFVQVYVHSIRRGSSVMARQIEKAFEAFDTTSSGVLLVPEMRALLQRMASGPLDEERLDEVLGELVEHHAGPKGSSKSPEEEFADAMIDKASLSRWMLSTYLNFLKDPSLVVDSVDYFPEFVYNQ